jgi:hypothetical protein
VIPVVDMMAGVCIMRLHAPRDVFEASVPELRYLYGWCKTASEAEKREVEKWGR